MSHMLFSNKAQNALDFPKIQSMLADCASTGSAKKKALCLCPTDDIQTVRLRLQRTADARRLIDAKGYPSFYAEEEVSAAAERADKGAVLSMTELLRISYLLRSARTTLDYIQTDKPFETVLDEIFLRLLPNRDLEERITRSIISEDMLADEASPALSDIRRKIRLVNSKIKDTLQSYVGGKQIKYLQENLVTMRDGRYVVPVKAEYRNEVKGLVHDMSASGSTLFIEPMAVVEANNELRRLQAEETHEIERILSELSALCADFSGSIRWNYLNLTELAFTFACASLANQMKAECPVIREKPCIKFNKARHPLIDRDKVVPIDVAIGENYRTLVITGPNTGGKTVTLKTAGLLVMMAQSGLHIPADEFSEMGVFSEVLVDIGDEQSIEQSLSTFSAHMVNIVDMMEHITDKSLVLFDELGAGTDPTEGAALAVSILDEVMQKGALSISTTHYAELKMYALDTEGVENACCEFDINTLKPTYRLIIGMPGKSNAFAISGKLGLSDRIIDHAQKMLTGEERRFERIIEELDKSRIEMDKNKDEAERLRREYENFKRESEIRLKEKIKEAELSAKRDSDKARQLLDSTRATCEYVLKQLDDLRKKQGTDHFSDNLAAAKKEMRRRLSEADSTYSRYGEEEVTLDEQYVLPRPLQIGDKVYVTTYKQEGIVTELPDKKGLVAVKTGIMRAKMPMETLRLLSDKATQPSAQKSANKTGEGKVKKTVSSDFRMELDVRGEYTDDAWFKIDKYLDEAMLAGVDSVRIIHGKGTGKLRAYLHEMLRTDRRIKSYRNGQYGEGDLGVTVVTFK